MNEGKKSKVATRLLEEVTQSRTSSLKTRFSAISSHRQEWAASGRTDKTEAQECKAWQEYGVQLALQKSTLLTHK
jgi:hypothetical protein